MKFLLEYKSFYKIGDKVFIYYYIVTKPTHEYMGGRVVRMRYEEVRRYQASEEIIQDILPHNQIQILNRIISEKNICQTLNEAKQKAKHAQEDYESACRFAERCR